MKEPSTKTHHFHTKLPYQKPMLMEIKWWVQNEPITKKEVFPVTTLFFRKFCFSLRSSYKDLIWCTNGPNANVLFVIAGVLFSGAFFPVSQSILKLLLIQRYAQFWFFKERSGDSSPTYFVYDFSRKLFFVLYCINWLNGIALLLLILKIFGDMCIELFLNRVATSKTLKLNFEVIFWVTKKSRSKLIYLEKEKSV